MDRWMNGWMDEWLDDWMDGDLSLKCFLFFPKQLVNCVGLVSNVQMPVSWTAPSVRPYYMHRRFNGHAAATNKQTNGCTWVDENPQAFLPFFLSFFLTSFVLCLVACCRTLNTSLQTLRVSVRCLLAASQAHKQATGAKLEVHIRHPWLITGLLVGFAFDTHKW